jgi:DNA replication protein DnaC
MKKTETKSLVLLQIHLKTLKLPTVLVECQKVASRCASDKVNHLGLLLQLCELKLIDRERRAAECRLRAATFPNHKTLDTFDFKAQQSLNKALLTELMRGEYIDKRCRRKRSSGNHPSTKSERSNPLAE